jgi:hypothetical protein
MNANQVIKELKAVADPEKAIIPPAFLKLAAKHVAVWDREI